MLPEGAPVAFELVATIHSFASRVFVTAPERLLEQRPSRDDFGFLGLHFKIRDTGDCPPFRYQATE
jgi:hypothetical protein